MGLDSKPILDKILERLALLAVDNPNDFDPQFTGEYIDGNTYYMHPQVQKQLTIQLTNIRSVGMGDHIITYLNADGDEVDADTDGAIPFQTFCQPKIFTLLIRVDSLQFDGWDMANKIHTRLDWQSTSDFFAENNTGVSLKYPINNISYRDKENKMINAYAFDCDFVTTDISIDRYSNYFVKSIELNSKFKNNDNIILENTDDIILKDG